MTLATPPKPAKTGAKTGAKISQLLGTKVSQKAGKPYNTEYCVISCTSCGLCY